MSQRAPTHLSTTSRRWSYMLRVLLYVNREVTMQGSQQQQAVVTNTGYVSQPYQTTSEVSSYANRQSTVIGILLIIMGVLSIVFNIVDLAVGANYNCYSDVIVILSGQSLGIIGHGFWCGTMVSGVVMVSFVDIG